MHAGIENEAFMQIEHIFPGGIDKIVFLAIVVVITVAVQIALVSAVKGFLSHEKINLPSPTIFLNILRLMIWAVGISFVLEPVFGINPATVLTAMGIGGLAVSFAMKDTLANIIAGIQLTISKVIIPGDYVHISGITGTIHDITWRQTTIESRLGELVSIPNSVLNTTALVKLPASVESFTSIPFTVYADVNPDEVAQDMIQTAYEAAGDRLVDHDIDPVDVKYLSFDQFGIKGELWLYVKPGVAFGSTKDLIVRQLMGKPYFMHIALPKNAEE